MPEASALQGISQISKEVSVAVASGEVQQLPSGKAGVQPLLYAVAAGEYAPFATTGQFHITKVSGVVILDGAPVYWDHSANACTPLTPTSDRDFFLGTAVGDATSASTTCQVEINEMPRYQASIREGNWITEQTDGLGVSLLPGGSIKLAFDAVNEVAQAAIYSERTFAVNANMIVEGRMAIYDVGDNAALDFDIGLASGSHATNFESISEFVSLHFDGNDLSLLTQSDDGTTDVTPVDTSVNAVDDTYFDFWIDARDHTNIAFYVNGVRVNSSTTHTLSAASGPLKLIAHMEKTADDTSADVRVTELRIRTSD